MVEGYEETVQSRKSSGSQASEKMLTFTRGKRQIKTTPGDHFLNVPMTKVKTE